MLQRFRKKLKIKQNYRTMSLMLVQILFLLVVVKSVYKKCIVRGSTLTPNTRSFTLMILYLKPKVVSVLAKT